MPILVRTAHQILRFSLRHRATIVATIAPYNQKFNSSKAHLCYNLCNNQTSNSSTKVNFNLKVSRYLENKLGPYGTGKTNKKRGEKFSEAQDQSTNLFQIIQQQFHFSLQRTMHSTLHYQSIVQTHNNL